MTLLREVAAELMKMFLGDARLSLAVLALVAGVALLIDGLGVDPLSGGWALLAGCLAVLAASLRAAARGRRRVAGVDPAGPPP